MTRYIYKILLILCMVYASQPAAAQTYPVQVVPVIQPPYSSKLSDYSNAMVNRISLQLVTTDLLIQNRAVQLHISIKGNGLSIQSSPVLSGIQPYYLHGGEILSLSSADLAGYFRYQNLQGISTTQYSEALPDGVYTICFQVYDVLTRQWLSQSSCATVYLMLNDPPQLSLPSDNEQIAGTDFPNIIFSWSPRHLNATNVSYDFELKEILNTALAPAFAFEVSPLLLREQGLRSTTLLYDLSKPALVPGKTYAWRVRAISTSGLAEHSVFRNNGYSQIYSFRYSTTCDAPRYLLSEQKSQSGVRLLWQGDNKHRQYHVQYRKAGVADAQWFEVYTVNTQTLLQGLEAGYSYEFRVGATCDAVQYGTVPGYVYSGIQTFSISREDNSTTYNCGIVPAVEISNQQPLGAMVVNETFMAGDFPVRVSEVSGQSGIYSGSGYIQVPYLFDTRIAVVFNNIRINSDYQLVEGVVETTYDPDWSNVDFVDDLWDVNQQTITVPFPIDSAGQISVSPGGDIVVTGPDGQTETFPGGKDSVITDSNGHTYYVDANGNVSGPEKQADGGKPVPQNTDGVSKDGTVTALTAEGIQVTFEQHTLYKYAYDEVTYNKALTKAYQQVNGSYIPFKAVVNGTEEYFVAKVAITDSSVNPDSLFFKTQHGVSIDAVRIKDSNDYVLQLRGAQKFAVEQVQATIRQGKKYKIAGVFNLVHISPRTISLRLVPASADMRLSDKIEAIRQIYSRIGIDVQIAVEPVFDISGYLSGGTLASEDSFGDLSTYSTAQQRIIADYKRSHSIAQAYYLFVSNAPSSNGQSGYMGLNNQFGFVFLNNATTIAHELGHGALRLEHPFRAYKGKGLTKGSTNSLMDDAAGTDFLFTDWQQISDPKFRLYAFQQQSEGELWGAVWINPLGEPFKLENTKKDLIYLAGETPKGSVAGYIVDADGQGRQFFKWNNAKKSYTLNGDDTGTLDDSYYKVQKPQDKDLINLYLEDGGCGKDKYYKATYEYVKAHYNTTDGISFADAENVRYAGNITCEKETKTYEQFFDEVTFPSIRGVQIVRAEDISQENINQLVAAVNNAVVRDIANYSYDKHTDKSKLGRIAIQDNINVNAEHLFKIDHKLVYLSEYTKSLQSPHLNIYVVYHKVDYFIKNGWNTVAKKVYENSTLKDKNAVLILIPYFEFTKEHVILDSYVEHYMPGLYSKGVQIETSAIGTLPSDQYRATGGIANTYKRISTNTTIDFVNRVYNQTYKPAEIFYGLRYADGSVSDEHRIIPEYSPGANAIKFVVLKEHQYYKQINRLYKPVRTYTVRTSDGPDTRINENYYSELLVYQITKAALEDEARANIQNSGTWDDIKNAIDFKEKYLDQQLARRYIYQYAYQSDISQFVSDLGVVYKGIVGEVPGLYETDHTYNKDAWSIIDDAVYGTIDVISLPLSVVGADLITDALGFAYATVRLDAVNSAIYGSAIIIPAYSGGIGHIVLKNTDDVVVLFKGFKYIKDGDKVSKLSGSALNETVLTFFKIKSNKHLISEAEVKEFYNLVTTGKVSSSDVYNVLQQADEIKRIQAIKALKTTAKTDILNTLKNVKLKNKGINNLNRLDSWSADELIALDRYINKYGDDLINELKTPQLFDVVERFVKQPDVNPWELIKELDNLQIENLVTARIGKSQFFKEMAGKGKAFEKLVSANIKTLNPPFADLIADGYTHIEQIQLLRLGSSNKIIADDLFVKKMYDELDDEVYYRAVISDSKLNAASPWTANQKSELIDIFKKNSSEKYIEFDVKSIDKNLPDNLKGKITIRIYRDDVYKIISDGDNIKMPPIKQF